MRRALVLSVTFATGFVAVAQTARADEFDVYRLSPQVDLPIAGVAVSLKLSSLFARPSHGGCGACDPLTLNGFDRIATERDSSVSRSISDITLYLAMASPLVIEAATIKDPFERKEVVFADTVVLAETMAMTYGLTSLLKHSIGRARPGAYRQGNMELDSFPSGHTSMAFASAAAGCSLYVRRTDSSVGESALACAPAFLLATTTAALRVNGGRHFPTDVLAGAAIGTIVGLLIPFMHGSF